MLFHAESACSWRSKCGRYQIVHQIAGFGMEVYRCNVEGSDKVHAELSLTKAQDWCREHNRIPETEHVGWDGNGSPQR